MSMPRTLSIPDDITRAVERLALESDASPEDLLIRAQRAHFLSLPNDLRLEFEAWDRASDEDLLRLESESGLG